MLTLKYYHLLFSANQNHFVQKCRNFNTHSINIFQYKKCFVQNKPNTYYRSKQCVYTDFYFKQTGTYYMPLSVFLYFPQTSSATSFTSRSFAHCSSSVSLLPISQEANPHWGLKYNLSSGMYFAASWILSMTSCLSSSTGDLVVISPRTTFFSPDTLAKGAKPPDLSSSNSRK